MVFLPGLGFGELLSMWEKDISPSKSLSSSPKPIPFPTFYLFAKVELGIELPLFAAELGF